MRARLLSLLGLPCFLFVSIFLTLPAFAGNWGENWGEMTWGEVIAAVPLTGKVGFLFLVFGLLGVVLWRFRSLVATGAISDDGIIDPRDTRTVVGLCLSVVRNKPIEGARKYGVFRL